MKIILYILILCNNLSKKLSFIFVLIENLISFIKDIKFLHLILNGFNSTCLLAVCKHGAAIATSCALCIQANRWTIIGNCIHNWKPFSDPNMVGVVCDFGAGNHLAASTTDSVLYICHICHAVACSGCHVIY